MKKLLLATMIGLGVMVSGCGHEQATPTLVQKDDGKYTMSAGDDYGISYVKGYSDDNVTNYKIIRVIGEDNNKTVDDYVKCYKNNGFKALGNVQYIGEAVEYKNNVYNAVNSTKHYYDGQKVIINATSKDDNKATIDGTFKEYSLAEVTNVERDDVGHLTHYTYKIVKDIKLVKGDVTEHFEVNE